MALAKRVIGVTFYTGNLAMMSLDFQATHGFAKITNLNMGMSVVCHDCYFTVKNRRYPLEPKNHKAFLKKRDRLLNLDHALLNPTFIALDVNSPEKNHPPFYFPEIYTHS